MNLYLGKDDFLRMRAIEAGELAQSGKQDERVSSGYDRATAFMNS